MKRSLTLAAVAITLASPFAHAAYWGTDPVPAALLQISMDNGVTYFAGFTVGHGCMNNRLELRETGDYYGNAENGKRMYALILAAKLQGATIQFGYNDADAPNCRPSGVQVIW